MESFVELIYQVGPAILLLCVIIVALVITYVIVTYLLKRQARTIDESRAAILEQQLRDSNQKLSSDDQIHRKLKEQLEEAFRVNETLEGKLKNKSIEGGKALEATISDYWKLLSSRLTPQNFASSKKKMESLFDRCASVGYPLPAAKRDEMLKQLQTDYETVLRKEFAKQEQARIREKIREEAKLEADRQREMQRLENEQLAIENAIQRAIQKSHDEHSDEVQRLQEKLAEAQAKMERAKSQAQLTKSGYVYVISNIGTFGENVFKVGMTRRLEPMDRISELSSASVPFPFDVHMMISCDNAPQLETKLHQELTKTRLNRVNFRKEFFRTDLDTIIGIVKRNHGEVEYVIDPEAIEYRNSLDMDPEDFDRFAPELELIGVESEN